MEVEQLEAMGDDFLAMRNHDLDAERRLQELTLTLERSLQNAAAAAGRVDALEVERDAWKRKYRDAARERDQARSAADALARSTSYRFGRAVTMLVRSPVKTAPRLVRALLRRLPAATKRFNRSTRHINAPTAPIAAVSDAAVNASRPATERKTSESRRPVLSERLPVHAYVALGFDLESLRSLVRAIGQCALAAGNHVPLVVTDVASFSMLRDTGVAFEYIPDRETWERHRSDILWDDFLSGRLGRLFQGHQPARAVFVNRSEPLSLAQLFALNANEAK